MILNFLSKVTAFKNIKNKNFNFSYGVCSQKEYSRKIWENWLKKDMRKIPFELVLSKILNFKKLNSSNLYLIFFSQERKI